VDSDSLNDAALSTALIDSGGLRLLQQYRLGISTDGGSAPGQADGETELEAASGLEARRRSALARQQEASKAVLDDPVAMRLVRAGIDKARREEAARRRAEHEASLALKEASDRMQCVQEVAITWGHREAAQFAHAQSVAAEKFDPVFWLVEHDLGVRHSGTPVQLWVKLTWTRSRGLSDIRIAPAESLTSAGYTSIRHETALGPMAIWTQLGKGRPITMLGCSTTREQEAKIRSQSFRKVLGCQDIRGEFVDEGATVWMSTLRPLEPFVTPDQEPRRALLQEARVLAAYVQSIEEEFAGGDFTVDTLVTEEVPRGRRPALLGLANDAQEEEEDAKLAATAAHDPVVAMERERIAAQRSLARCRAQLRNVDTESLNAVAADFLGLERADMDMLHTVFLDLTRFHGGAITARELGRMLGIEWTPLAEAFVYFMDADVNPDAMSVASFVRGFAVPCSFGMAEAIAFLFFVVATNMVGEVPVNRSRPPSRSVLARGKGAVSHEAATPRDFWKHSSNQMKEVQSRRGFRESDPIHTLACVFNGQDTLWSGVVATSQVDATVPVSGIRRALGMLAWELPDGAAVVNATADRILADTAIPGAGSFVAFKRAITLDPRLMLTVSATIRGLQGSIVGRAFWQSKDTDFARARAVTQSRLQLLQASRPSKQTAEEAMAAAMAAT
jgi:hypothetical protein